MPGNLYNRSSGVQLPCDICTGFGMALFVLYEVQLDNNVNYRYLHDCELQENAGNVNFLFLLSTHPINSLSKAGKALVNTISSTSYAVPLYR